jgi:uncharacterized RDD family membrane protein YckC
MIETTNFNETDVLGQKLPPVYIRTEDIHESNSTIDYSKTYVLPSIKTRYFSMLIDIIVIILLSLAISTVLEKISQVPDYIRGFLFLFVIILYEPILVTIGTTIGQYFLDIKVRNFNNPELKLSFPKVLLRFVIKVFLGWLSFLTVTFNVNRRAIHDFASGSIMIANKIEVK